MMIGEGLCNGIVALTEALSALGRDVPFELVSLTGGIADNAIPAKAQAVIAIDAENLGALERFAAERQAALREAYAGAEDRLTITVEAAEPASQVFEAEQTECMLAYVTEAINGVYTMSEAIEGLVESSSNLGVINATADGIEIRQMPRSSSPQRLAEIEAQYRALAAENGLAIDIAEGSRPWPVNEDSVMAPRIQQIYREQNGEEIEVAAIHAGLECGVFYELVDGLDMASIGPDVVGAHSPDETLYLASISKIWHLLEDLLVSLE